MRKCRPWIRTREQRIFHAIGKPCGTTVTYVSRVCYLQLAELRWDEGWVYGRYLGRWSKSTSCRTTCGCDEMAYPGRFAHNQPYQPSLVVSAQQERNQELGICNPRPRHTWLHNWAFFNALSHVCTRALGSVERNDGEAKFALTFFVLQEQIVRRPIST